MRHTMGEALKASVTVVNEWQPIETAPKDGTILDLWHKSGFRVVDQWWCDDDTFAGLDTSDFTHWMLPNPPEDKP